MEESKDAKIIVDANTTCAVQYFYDRAGGRRQDV